MKNNQKYTSFEKYKLNPLNKNTESIYFSQNNIGGNISLEEQDKMFPKDEHNPFHFINSQSSKQNRISLNNNSNLHFEKTKFYRSLNKEYFEKEYYVIEPYKQEDSLSYEDYICKTNINLQPFEMYSQTIDDKQKNIFGKNNKVNVDENKYPSNYSYYESKYTKKKKNEFDNNNNFNSSTINHSSNFQNTKNIKFYTNEKNILSNSSLNRNLNRSHVIAQNSLNKNEVIKTPKNNIIQSHYYKFQKEKINNLSSYPTDNKRTIIIKNSYNTNINNNSQNIFHSYNSINNANINLINQPHTPSVNSQFKITNSPPKKKENYLNIHELNNNNIKANAPKNSNERSLTTKNIEKIKIKKLIVNQSKNRNIVKYKQVDLSGGNKGNITEPFKISIEQIPSSPKEIKINNFSKSSKNASKNINISNNIINNNINININNDINNINNNINNNIYKTINEKSNKSINNTIKSNKGIITITNLKENNKIIRNINFNTAEKSLTQENKNNQNNELKNKTEIKNNIKFEKKKKKTIKGIKIIDSEKFKKLSISKNEKFNNNISKGRIIDISEKIISRNKDNKEHKENKDDKDNKEKKDNKDIKFSKSNIINRKSYSKNFEDEKEYFKEVANIMYDHNSEPRNQVKYNVKENNNYNINKNFTITKERSGQFKENIIRNNYPLRPVSSSKENTIKENLYKKFNNNSNSNNKINNSINIYTNNDMILRKNTQNINYNSNSNILETNNFQRRYSYDVTLNKNNNLMNINNNLKRNNSNTKIPVENDVKTPIESKNNNNKETLKIQNHQEKTQINNNKQNSNNYKVEPFPKKPRQKSYRLSENSKYESRANEIPKKTEADKKENEDEWDKMQYMGMRKKTYDPGLRPGKKRNFLKKDEKGKSLNAEFTSTIYVKVSEGLTIPGKNEYGLKKTNQDTFIIEKNVNGVLNFNFFGVMDGHGEDGHLASQFVSRYIFHRIKTHPLIKKEDEPKKIYYKLIANGYEIIANIFLDADVQIQKEKFNVKRSGTTCVIVIQLEEHIICANTGDSRAIAVFDQSYDDNLVDSKVYPLSYDCKPELPNEAKRIIEHGGVVEKAFDDEEDAETGPYRVWARGEDYPGLAMSRSIGDMDAKKVGVIPNPQIVEYTIDYFSKYLIMASDGIWEFISSEQAMKLSNKYYLRNDPIGLCQELSQKAITLWEKNDCVIDDITVIVVFF